MEKKIMIDTNKEQTKFEIWEYNRKGFYNFKQYISFDSFNIKEFKRQYKKYTIIDRKHLLNSFTTKHLITDTGLHMQL